MCTECFYQLHSHVASFSPKDALKISRVKRATCYISMLHLPNMHMYAQMFVSIPWLQPACDAVAPASSEQIDSAIPYSAPVIPNATPSNHNSHNAQV